MTDKRYTKVEEEIIQILDRLENEQPARPRPHLKVVPSQPKPDRRFNLRKPAVRARPAWTWLILSFAAAVVAYFIRDFSSTLTLLVAIASAGLFFAPLFSRGTGSTPPSATTTKTWRGQDISFKSDVRESPSERARRWIADRRGGTRRY